MKIHAHNALRYFTFNSLDGVRHGVFTRKGGVSAAPWRSLNIGGTVGDDEDAVRTNHELIYEALGLQARNVCTVWQVHGADTVIVNGPVRGRQWIAQADGMVTDRPDTPLLMRYADCTPIIFSDPVKAVIGIAHAGWRGTVAGAGRSVVNVMGRAYGSRPADIVAAIGPSIGPERYQVGQEVVDAVHAYFGTTDDLISWDPTDQSAYLDLWAANRRDLERSGIEQIEVAGMCTASNTDAFFSHRAEQGKTGRFAVAVSI